MLIQDLSDSPELLTLQDYEQVANAVVRRGLQVPAIFFLELHKPLTRLGHTSVLFCAPLLQFILGRIRVEKLLELLSCPQNVEQLISTIEKQGEEG